MANTIDPLTLGSVWRSLRASANDAGSVLQRTAYSEAVREGRDFSVAIFDREGRMVAQGDFSPGHLGSMPESVLHVLARYPAETLEDGDAILFNDPWLGSGHLPDFLLTSPIFLGQALVGYIVTCSHMIDVGGAVFGSQAVSGIEDVYQEGLRLMPVMAFRRGSPNREVMSIIEANVRVPEKVIGDLHAMRACNAAGARSVGELIRRVGSSIYADACQAILDESERAMRVAIETIPDGRYSAADWLDDAGPGTEPIKIAATVVIDRDQLTIDFGGSDAQTRSGLNAVANYSKAYCFFVVKALTHGPNLPQNAGSIAAIGWRAPEGSVMNASPPSGVGARATMQQRIVDVLMQAFAQALPSEVIAPSSHWANPVFGGIDPRTGRRFVLYDIIVGGWGGRMSADGVEAMCPSFNIDSIPTEINEQSYPILVERYELITDSAGPGEFRGGCGVRKDVRLLADDVVLSNLGDRHRIAPPGLLGGSPGAIGRTILNPGADATELHSKGVYRLKRDDLVSYRLAGGGGFGNPERRDPTRVRADVSAGVVSREAARASYKVAIDDEGEIDRVATEELRRDPERRRSDDGKP